jgi:hypothetical protein
MKDKNEFRYMQENGTIEGYKWYHKMVDSFKQEINTMLDMIRSSSNK